MELNELISALQLVQKNKSGGLHTKAPADYNTAHLLTQPGGLFGIVGIDRAIISTHIQPSGLGALLPAFASTLDDPRYGLLTGFGPEAGEEAVYPCDDAPMGYVKAGTLTAQFGRLMRQTNTVEIDALLHDTRIRSTGLQLINESLGGGTGIMPSGNVQEAINQVVKMEMTIVGVNMERKLAAMLWSGSPSNNTANGGYKEFPGLDAQIATGQKDAESGVLLPSADSLVINFNDAIDSTAKDIVEWVSSTEMYLRNKAERQGLMPVQWVIAMRPEMFHELTKVWACRYLTDRCTDSSGSGVITINDDTAVRMRDEMRNGNYLVVNGRRIPVVTDDGIYEYNSTNTEGLDTGEFKSSIYFVPLTVRGSFRATYWEYIDYRQIGAQLSALGEGQRNVPFWSEGGRLLWVYRENGYCFDLQAKIEPRVILRTPHLAAKIQNVMYTPFIHFDSPFTDSPYWKNGGLSTRSVATSQAVWR